MFMFHSTQHVCLQAVKIAPAPRVVLCMCCYVSVFLVHVGGQFSPGLLLVLASNLVTTPMVSHLFSLCSPYLYRACGVSVEFHHVVTG